MLRKNYWYIMKIRTLFILIITHLAVGVFGFMLGTYALPILIAPPAPSEAEINQMTSGVQYSAEFRKDLKDSDALHWGEGRVSVGPDYITLLGTLAPGPDYKLYLSPKFVETEADFKQLKPSMLRVGSVKTFENFAVKLSPDTDLSQYNTVIIWCEAFGQFITAGKYR